MTIHPVNISAIQGVLRFWEMLAKKLGSIRSRPSAYDALVAEYIVAFKAEIEANMTANVRRKLPNGIRREIDSPNPLSFLVQNG